EPMKPLAIAFVLIASASAFAQQQLSSSPNEKPQPTLRQLTETLSETFDTSPFRKQQTLKEALKMLQEAYQSLGKELPIHIDHSAFKEVNPDAPDIEEAPVALPELPRRLTGSGLLRSLLAQVPTNNADFTIEPGAHVTITTTERAAERMAIPNQLGRLLEVN